jgi:cell division protease FtsH
MPFEEVRAKYAAQDVTEQLENEASVSDDNSGNDSTFSV